MRVVARPDTTILTRTLTSTVTADPTPAAGATAAQLRLGSI